MNASMPNDMADPGSWESDHDRGLPGQRWYRAARAVVRDGYLYPEFGDLRARRRYMAALRPQVMTDLVKLPEGDERAVVDFALRWGPLGYGEALADLGGGWSTTPEPLTWIWAHARGVRVGLRLFEYLTTRDTRGLLQFLQSLRVTMSEGLRMPGEEHVTGEIWPVVLVGQGDDVAPLRGSFANRKPAEVAASMLTEILNSNLSRLHPYVEIPVEGGTYRIQAEPGTSPRIDVDAIDEPDPPQFEAVQVPRFAALVDVVYSHLLGIAGPRGRGAGSERPWELARCEQCGAFFPRTHGRQRFCPPDPWKATAESNCARRARSKAVRREARHAHARPR